MSEVLALLEYKADELYTVIQILSRREEELPTFDVNGTLQTFKRFDPLVDKEIYVRILPKVREIEILVNSQESFDKTIGMLASKEHE